MRARFLIPLLAFSAPLFASAHEVYVLSPEQVTLALHIAPFNMPAVVLANLHQFLFWAFIGVFVVLVVLGASVLRPFERWLDPMCARLRPYAAPIARVTVGLSFLAGAYYQASYGPELPLAATFGSWSGYATVVLLAIGLLLIIGLYVRFAALVALGFFAIAVWYHGVYMLTYTNYLGEVLVLLILGMHRGSEPHAAAPALAKRLAPYSFALLRVCFGISLLYASLYAKVLHNNLALMVAELPLGHAHSVAQVLGFEPHFLVLGAAIIEIAIASFFILGIEIRFTSLFLLFWLSLSLLYFGESVWPHVILIGIPIAFICYGYDRYSLEGRFLKRGAREPVL